MLLLVAAILVVLWLLGFIGNVGGEFIHVLIVAAVVVVIYNFIVGRRHHTV